MNKALLAAVVLSTCWAQHQHQQPQMGVPQMGVPQVGGPQMGAPQQQQYMQQQYGTPQHQQGYMQQPQQGLAAQQGGSFIHNKAHVQDRAHIQEHLSEVVGNNQDLSKMSEEELQFHYFKLHDSDDNNKLDGLELIKSLIHWHVEESKHIQQQQGQQAGQQTPPHVQHGTTKLFTDQELSALIDPILEMDDRNRDGFIDYPEFVAAQKQRGF
ncbi:multiple coagulation factor deficiency protein 2 homolog [Ornithodoros turicata]|uniref:multiple coagulation factor deficiency protein 2 homolog n=1 Tax=Ornithodoros turicata TaxID=34597 RepID=UPI003139ABF2